MATDAPSMQCIMNNTGSITAVTTCIHVAKKEQALLKLKNMNSNAYKAHDLLMVTYNNYL